MERGKQSSINHADVAAHTRQLEFEGRFRRVNPTLQERRPRRVMRDYQRAHETLPESTKRLAKKYGADELLATAHGIYEETRGMNYAPPAQKSVRYFTLSQVAEELGIPKGKLGSMVEAGVLENIGTLEHPTRPGKGLVLINEREVPKLKEILSNEEEVPRPKLLTLPEAAQTHDLPYGTLRSWHRSGQLPEKGREVFHTHGGGKILVDEKDIVRLKNHWTPKKKPRH
jgi:hypothetical protein